MVAEGVGVAIADAVAEGGPVTAGIAQVARYFLAAGAAHRSHRIKEAQGAVALLRVRQIEGGLGEGVEALRQAHLLEGCRAGLNYHDRLRIRQADVLTGGDQQAAEEEAGIFAGLHHAGQPEQGGVGIRAADRLDEGADRVVVGIALFVVEHRPLLDRFLGDRQIDADLALAIGGGGLHRQFEGVEQAAGIAAGHIEQVGLGLVAEADGPLSVAPLRIGQGAVQQLAKVAWLQPLEPEQAGAADEGLVDFEVGVFGGGADEGDGAVLHPRQQGVLLGRIEAVHLIDEQDRAQAVALQPLAGGLHLGSQLLHAREHGVEAGEVGAGGVGDDARQGGLAGARGAVQDQVAHPVGGDGAAQQPAVAEDRLLAGEFLKGARAHAIRQGGDAAQGFFAVVAEQIAHPWGEVGGMGVRPGRLWGRGGGGGCRSAADRSR